MSDIDMSLYEVMALPGARGAALVDWTCGLALGSAGESPRGQPEAAAVEAAELARCSVEYGTFRPPEDDGPDGAGREPDGAGREPGGTGRVPGGTGFEPGSGSAGLGGDGPRRTGGTGVEDLIVTTRTAYHVLRFVETGHDSSLFLHLWLDRDAGNLAVARIRLKETARRLVLG
ncbi:hypothetical protein GCM10018785_52340 [Streptomyces longispororuber]|uniref:Uncharacterized protein n=1 Tax=Streptomyces longispororuber TaxID=68230 RepID=A0A918ZZX3_9ACTN|nr:hypothetical protein [Streptomyces longispororuber]GHE77592.1 hypothetical protein GCM10018785_52340 [Streptomyces longispororuber]